jgi:hypothetical protein
LCGLYLVDLHLRGSAACGQCDSAHVHICHREGNANGSRAITKHPWRLEDGVVCGGAVRRASPAMISSYFRYAGIRFPERLYQRLDERRRTSLVRFEHRHARLPTADERARMALFPSGKRNPGEARSIAYSTFHNRFKAWADGLDLGSCVPHQARHTLATKLLKHGATLSHIRQYLGQLSERMAEHDVTIEGRGLRPRRHPPRRLGDRPRSR